MSGSADYDGGVPVSGCRAQFSPALSQRDDGVIRRGVWCAREHPGVDRAIVRGDPGRVRERDVNS